MALRQVTDRFIFLQEGDLVELSSQGYSIYDPAGASVERPLEHLDEKDQIADKGEYRHYMQKEIFEQVSVLAETMAGRLAPDHIREAIFGYQAEALFAETKHIHIVACGTSYHSGLVAKYWLEEHANVPCQVEVASEYRYRKVPVPAGTLFVTISQSGETADTLAALRKAKESKYLGFVSICNVANSSLVRESNISLMTMAGVEVGVASTKAFTTQLVALQLLTLALGRHTGLASEVERELVINLHLLPGLCAEVLALDSVIAEMSQAFANKQHALFLGRGEQYPIALEGALKLKEISYIHAEAYPSGELKHGPLALVDDDMPVVTVAPNNALLEKLKSNLHEVRARGGQLFVFADADAGFVSEPGTTVIAMPHVPKSLEPIIYTLPLQMLSYHVAVLKGTDVDQPRNLAKVGDGGVIEEGVVLEFSIETQSNNLTYHSTYSKRQQITFNLIEYLHDDKGWGYRVIAKKMNSWGIKTQRGKTWSNGSVHSVLKRMHERDVRIENIRNKKYPIKISKMVVRCHTV